MMIELTDRDGNPGRLNGSSEGVDLENNGGNREETHERKGLLTGESLEREREGSTGNVNGDPGDEEPKGMVELELGSIKVRPKDYEAAAVQPLESFERPRNIVELSTESEKALGEDLELFAEEFSVWSIHSEESRRQLMFFREALIMAARKVQHEKPDIWTGDVPRKLQQALTIADTRASGHVAILDDSMFSTALEPVGRDSLRFEALQTTFFENEIDMRHCVRVTAGWLCLWTACYSPWIIFGSYGLSTYSPVECGDEKYQYVLGVVIFLGINGIFNWLLSCCNTVNRGETLFSRHSTTCIVIITISFMAYNIYGLTLIWSPQADPAPLVESDCNFDNYIFAIVILFLVVPCVCFPIQCWLDQRKRS